MLSSLCGPGSLAPRLGGGGGASPRPPELGRWPSRSGFRAPALPAATLSLIGSCRHGSLMEFNFQQEGWVGSRLAPVTLIKCLGKPGPPLILPPPPRPLLPAELRAEPGRRGDGLTSQRQGWYWRVLTVSLNLYDVVSPRGEYIPDCGRGLPAPLPAGTFLSFAGVPVSMDGPQGVLKEEGWPWRVHQETRGTCTSG